MSDDQKVDRAGQVTIAEAATALGRTPQSVRNYVRELTAAGHAFVLSDSQRGVRAVTSAELETMLRPMVFEIERGGHSPAVAARLMMSRLNTLSEERAENLEPDRQVPAPSPNLEALEHGLNEDLVRLDTFVGSITTELERLRSEVDVIESKLRSDLHAKCREYLDAARADWAAARRADHRSHAEQVRDVSRAVTTLFERINGERRRNDQTYALRSDLESGVERLTGIGRRVADVEIEAAFTQRQQTFYGEELFELGKSHARLVLTVVALGTYAVFDALGSVPFALRVLAAAAGVLVVVTVRRFEWRVARVPRRLERVAKLVGFIPRRDENDPF